jgi:hypothetical protein
MGGVTNAEEPGIVYQDLVLLVWPTVAAARCGDDHSTLGSPLG